MSKARRFASIKRKADTATTFLRLGLVGVSAFLLYRKFKSDQAEEQARQLRAQNAAIAQSGGGVPGATVPLVAPTDQPLPSPQPEILRYGDATPDQTDTTRLIPTVQIQPLDPNAIASQLISAFDARARA